MYDALLGGGEGRLHHYCGPWAPPPSRPRGASARHSAALGARPAAWNLGPAPAYAPTAAGGLGAAACLQRASIDPGRG